MKSLLLFALFAALCLVPLTVAAHAPVVSGEEAACGQINLQLGWDGHLGPPWTWHIKTTGTVGPYIIFYGPNHGTGTYKGCPFETSGEIQFPPLVGDINTTFQTPGFDDIDGYWQVLSANQTSNTVHIF